MPGPFDDGIFDMADQLVARMADRYLEWAGADIARLRQAIAEAKAAPAGERTGFTARLYGISHDIKGQGGSFDYPLMSFLGDRLCRAVESGRIDDESLALAAEIADAMECVVLRRLSGGGGDDGAALRSRFAR